MPTRYNTQSRPYFGVPGLQSGFAGDATAPSDLTIPAVGIEDVDMALFHLFDKELPLEVSVSDKNRAEIKRVPVIFGSGEKWAMLKRGRAIRDRNNTLILPLITITREVVQQTPNDDVTGRGINQQTGEIVIRRRLDKSDRAYQKWVNRLLLKNQQNLAVPTGQGDSGQLTTGRTIGDLADDPMVQDGALLVPDRKNNTYETIVIPAPQFFTAVYEVTFWTQYTVQMVQLIEQLISSFLPQAQSWRLDTPKGYWFVATVDGNVYNPENNFDDMSQEERLIKYKFSVKVPGYMLGTRVPGAPVPLRRYVSAPTVSFDIGEESQAGNVDDPFLGADDPTLSLADGSTRRRDQRRTGSTRLFPNPDVVPDDDPARLSVPRGQQLAKYKRVIGLDRNGKQVTRFVRVSTRNRYTGETVFASDTDLGGLTIVVIED